MSAGEVNRMAALLAHVAHDGRLEFSEADAIARQAIRGTMDEKRLVMAKDFFESPPATVEQHGPVLASSGGQALAQTLYWGMPRELRGQQRSGQAFTEGNTQTADEFFLGDRPEYPLSFEVKGTARRDYSLSFKIAEQELTVNVPKGATPEQTAALVANAINGHSDQIAESSMSAGALHFQDSDAYCIGVAAKADGAVVRIAPRIDA